MNKRQRNITCATLALCFSLLILAHVLLNSIPLDPRRTFAPQPASLSSSSRERGKEQQPTSSQTSSHATQSVAVATLFTVSARTPDGIGPSIDGAFVLRHSILATLPSQHFVSTETRFVGLDSFSQYSAHFSDGIKQEVVDVYRFQSPGGSRGDLVNIELRFVALVTPDVPPHFIPMIRGIGYEVWMTHSPINASEIRNEQIRQETLVDGAMGISELTKLDGLRMGREFDTVIMVDCDVMFHKLFTIDNPREKIQVQVNNEDFSSPSSVWAPGAGGLLNIEAILGWTKGGWVSERINGGFLVFSPRHPRAALHLQRIVELLREGDFRPGSGWKGRGIGWTYGGRTIQGVLPHYFFLEAAEDHNNNNNSNTTSTTLKFRSHVQLDRCRYNNMVQLEPCKVVPFSTVTSNHFTGDCVKPWTCAHRPHPLCGQFVDAWLDTYRMALLGDPRVRHVVKKSDELSVFAMAKWVKSGGRCPGRGHFVSLAASMLRYAPLH